MQKLAGSNSVKMVFRFAQNFEPEAFNLALQRTHCLPNQILIRDGEMSDLAGQLSFSGLSLPAALTDASGEWIRRAEPFQSRPAADCSPDSILARSRPARKS